MKTWIDGARVYFSSRLLAVLFMGFSSGLPLALTAGTMTFWLAELGLSYTVIGLSTLVGAVYSLKFLWSPIIDRLPLGAWTTLLGRRRSWALSIQILLALAILVLGLSDPRENLSLTIAIALAVAFLSASQDIVIDAYRIELLRLEEQGAGAAATQWGYRFGLLASSAGALYIAEFGGWWLAYAVMAALMSVGMAAVLLTPEPAVPAAAMPTAPGGRGGTRLAAWLKEAVVGPFADFTTRPSWIAILLFVVLFKFGDALAGSMANPFYIAVEFTRIEVANISKLFGTVATLSGLAVGGLMVAKLGLYRSLLLGGILQMLSNLMYVLQAWAGHDVELLAATIFVENFSGGLGSAAFVAYLSSLCNVAFTATQYALLSSLAAVGRTTLASSGGWLVDHVGWIAFFTLSTVAALPGLAMALWLMRRLRAPQLQPAFLEE
jgi:PAT family beta-lactamase induction signal transducer AmpG